MRVALTNSPMARGEVGPGQPNGPRDLQQCGEQLLCAEQAEELVSGPCNSRQKVYLLGCQMGLGPPMRQYRERHDSIQSGQPAYVELCAAFVE